MLAVADPKTPPYGAAIKGSSRVRRVPLRAANALVSGKSVGEAQPLASSGDGNRGFVACAQMLEENDKPTASVWLIPAARRKRLDQDAVVLSRTAKPQLATEFLHWTRCAQTLPPYEP